MDQKIAIECSRSSEEQCVIEIIIIYQTKFYSTPNVPLVWQTFLVSSNYEQ